MNAKRICAALTAAVMALMLALPVFAVGETQPRFETPEGYNENDYRKLVSFLETEDDNGVKNGEKLSPDYDPADPETWGDADAHIGWIPWSSDYRLGKLFFDGCDMVGALDLSDCEELDEVHCADVALSAIDLSGTSVYYKSIAAEGVGRVALMFDSYGEYDCIFCCSIAIAVPIEGGAFIGWYTENGEFISNDLTLPEIHAGSERVTARFTAEGEEFFFNAHDLGKLLSFFETEDENGVKNGEKLSSSYDPEKPEIWPGIEWKYSDGELFLKDVFFGRRELVGSIDLSGCVWLKRVSCGSNSGVTALLLADCPELESISCSSCSISLLDLTGCAKLNYLGFGSNPLSSVDVSDCPLLESVYVDQNPISELDFSNNPLIFFDRIGSEGRGYVGISCVIHPEKWYEACADPEPGYAFLGWYSEEGNLLSTSRVLYSWNGAPNVVARFEGSSQLPAGDANGDGAVGVDDALLVLRHAMSLTQLPGEYAPGCDVNGDGAITLTDALLVLRFAMGTIGGFRCDPAA